MTTVPLLLATVFTLSAQDQDWCYEWRGRGAERGWHCEVREFTMPAPEGVLRVDGGLNGGIEVEGWDETHVLVEARVSANARDDDDARDLVSRVTIEEGGTIRARGPSMGDKESWSVSFRVFVPRRSDLDLETHNGGIAVRDLAGRVRFDALNGGVRLEELAGDIRGSTTNGGLHVRLDGERWDGAGMDVRTTNGGVQLAIPDDYNAHIETGTVNGGVWIDFPVVVQGNVRSRAFTFDVGEGGATVRVTTTNGGVRVQRS